MSQKNNYEWLSEYCLAQLGATTEKKYWGMTKDTKDYNPDWEATLFLVGGKMFATLCNYKDGRPLVTVKLEPAFGALLREQYEHIIPGYYMNKEHWNSLYLEGDVPDEVVQTMVIESHKLIFESLSKKMQKEILEG